MKKGIAILGLSATLLCFGCGKSKDNVEDDFSAVATNETEISTTEQGIDTTVPEHINKDIVGAGGNWTIKLDADIDADLYQKATVYSVNNVEIDEEYVKQLAGNLFDNGKYEVLVPYYLLDKDSLSEVIDSHGGLEMSTVPVDENSCYLVSLSALQANEAKNLIDESQVSSLQEGLIFYEYNDRFRMLEYDPANGIWREVGDTIEDQISYARLVGTIDGKEYELNVKKYKVLNETRMWICATDGTTNSAYSVPYGDENVPYETDNCCDYETSKKIAYDIVVKIAGDNYDLCASYSRNVLASDAKRTAYNGYTFYFNPMIDYVPMAYNSNYSIMDSMEAFQKGIYTNQPMLSVVVDSTGFVEAKFLNQIDIEECLSSSPELLSFDQVMEQIPIKADDLLADVKNYTIDINRIQLGYVEVKHQDGYAVVPVWMFYESNSGYVSIKENATFGINALDGSIVLFDTAIDDYFNVPGQR